MHPQQQLTLNVQLRDDATLENYLCASSNLALLKAVEEQLKPQGEPIIYIYGPADAGKSHLLQAACHLAQATPVLYLPLSELANYSPEDVLQGVESMGLVCLDDVHTVMGNDAWELALFHFFNRAREHNCRLLVSATAAPRELQVKLADLRSRLSWGIVYQLEPINDEDRQAILCFRAARRGLQLSSEVSRYITDRAPRALSQLLELLDTLDTASLVAQRSLSIPFVKKALGW
ncbi:MAG: DnaA regulatory inactivator Hda [Proteobacteria bacterium]|nr:DnaA regulatory inactivator Hda [Pseudomonadota bacterium]